MLRSPIVKTILLAAAAFCLFAGFYIVERNLAPATSKLTYSNQAYGFSIQYPSNLRVKEYIPEQVSVGVAAGTDGFDSIADVSVVKGGNALARSSSARYDDFIVRQSELMCAADGPGISIDCEGLARRQSFVTLSGLSGEYYYLREITRNSGTGSTTVAEKGPFYAFNISANGDGTRFLALIIHAPIAKPKSQIDESTIRGVADSLSIDKIEARE